MLEQLLDKFDKYPFTDRPEKDKDARFINDDGVTFMEILMGAKMFSSPLRAVIRSNSTDPRHPDIAVLPHDEHLHFLVCQTTDGSRLPDCLKGSWRSPKLVQEKYSDFLKDVQDMTSDCDI